jgi:hypothetical protein
MITALALIGGVVLGLALPAWLASRAARDSGPWWPHQ